MAEGRNIAYRIYQNQRQGIENTPSIESLIDLSEQMVKKSTDLHKESDQVTPSPDLIKEKLGDEFCKPKEKESIEEFTDKLTYNDVIKTEKQNLEALNSEYASLHAQKEDNDEKRRKLEAFKKRMNVNENQLQRLKDHVESKPTYGQTFVDSSAFKPAPTDKGR